MNSLFIWKLAEFSPSYPKPNFTVNKQELIRKITFNEFGKQVKVTELIEGKPLFFGFKVSEKHTRKVPKYFHIVISKAQMEVILRFYPLSLHICLDNILAM